MLNSFFKVRRAVKRVIAMIPRAKLYGIRYLFDKEYRRVMKQREENRKFRKKLGNNWQSRRRVFVSILVKKYGRRCEWCEKLLQLNEITLDHIKPISEGGETRIENLRILCRECHLIKDSPKKKTDFKPFVEAFERIENS